MNYPPNRKEYLKMLATLGRRCKQKTGRPLSPIWRNTFGAKGTGDKSSGGAPPGDGEESMTRVSAGSFRAALRASGSALPIHTHTHLLADRGKEGERAIKQALY
jgi:hypothetical protein